MVQPIEQSLKESNDIEFVKRGPVAADLNGGRRTFDWNHRRGSTESHISDISNADECPPLPPLPVKFTLSIELILNSYLVYGYSRWTQSPRIHGPNASKSILLPILSSWTKYGIFYEKFSQ